MRTSKGLYTRTKWIFKITDEEAATHSPVAELEHKPKNEKILEPISKKHQNSLTGWVLKISLKLNQ